MVTRGRERKGGLSNLLHLAFARLFGLGWGVFVRTIMAAMIYSDDRDIHDNYHDTEQWWWWWHGKELRVKEGPRPSAASCRIQGLLQSTEENMEGKGQKICIANWNSPTGVLYCGKVRQVATFWFSLGPNFALSVTPWNTSLSQDQQFHWFIGRPTSSNGLSSVT